MAKPKMIGNINCYLLCNARFGRKNFTFDGTIRGLVRSAYAAGARAGAVVHASFGFEMKPVRIVSAPHDDRAFGLWADARG